MSLHLGELALLLDSPYFPHDDADVKSSAPVGPARTLGESPILHTFTCNPQALNCLPT